MQLIFKGLQRCYSMKNKQTSIHHNYISLYKLTLFFYAFPLVLCIFRIVYRCFLIHSLIYTIFFGLLPHITLFYEFVKLCMYNNTCTSIVIVFTSINMFCNMFSYGSDYLDVSLAIIVIKLSPCKNKPGYTMVYAYHIATFDRVCITRV